MQKFTILILLLLASCGFKPMLAKDSESADLLTHIKLKTVTGLKSVKSRDIVEKIFDPASVVEPLYFLNLDVQSENTAFAVLKDSQTTRYRVKTTINYNIVNVENNKIVNTGSLYIFNSYDVAYSEFMNYTSNRYASDIGLKELCDQLKIRVTAILANQIKNMHNENSSQRH